MKKNYFLLGLAFISISAFTHAQTDPGATNLKHQWTFEDGNANDKIGTVNGTLMDGASVADGALSTSGGYVELDGAALAINSYSELTVSAWFTSDLGMNTSYHFLYYFGGQDGINGANMTGYTPARGNDVSRAMIMTGNGEKGVNGAEYDDGILHHVVCVVDATNLTYYLDGALMGTASIGANTLANVATDLAYFGKGGWSNDLNWSGKIDDISIYDKALTADNVKFLYNLHKPTPLVAENPGTANLTHQWTFNDGNADDKVGTVHGTLLEGATVADGALSTNGGYVELDGAALAVNNYSALSVEAWFTSTAASNNSFHFLYYLGGQNGNDGANFTGYTPARGQDCSRAMINTGGGEKGLNGAEYDEGILHHVVTVVDDANISYYLDGALMGTTAVGSNTLAGIATDLAYFGKGGWNADLNWTGSIYKISMFDKALTASNVKYLYNLGSEGSTGVHSAKDQVQKVYVANNQIVAEFESAAATEAQIDVYDVQGKLVASDLFTCNAGANYKTIKTDLAKGLYLVRLVVDGQSSTSKIVK